MYVSVVRAGFVTTPLDSFDFEVMQSLMHDARVDCNG